MTALKDTLSRPLRDLRISVTDRCNFRCRYCMPAEIFGTNYHFLPKQEILSFEEIETLTRLLVEMGVKKVRITGGEPLLRRDLPKLIERLVKIKGIEDIAMTTNGVLLKKYAAQLKSAGLQRVTVSLDALDEKTFAEMNGVGAKPSKVLEGINAALEEKLGVKINSVIKKKVNEQEVLPLVKLAQKKNIPVRFIEFMDTGNTNQWQMQDVVPSAEQLKEISKHLNLEPKTPANKGETAVRYAPVNQKNTGFEIGFISSVTQAFCSQCNRARLSADGKLFACLFAAEGKDVKNQLRQGKLEQLRQEIQQFWQNRNDRYSELRSQGISQQKPEMSYIGG